MKSYFLSPLAWRFALGLLFVLSGSPGALRAATFTVTTTNLTGAGSLSQAITDANGSAGADLIQFNIASGGLTIGLTNALPAITEAVTLDGASQPGFAGA